MGYRAKPNMGHKYTQGIYNLINPNKYLGQPENIYFRSSWEYKLYFYLDNEPRVIRWNVEGITVPYEMKDDNGSWHTMRYHPDAYAEIVALDGSISKNVIEIKPYNETIPPEQPKRVTAKSLENHEYRLRTYLKNLNKWKNAKEFCDKRGLNFMIMTEKYFDGKQIKIF